MFRSRGPQGRGEETQAQANMKKDYPLRGVGLRSRVKPETKRFAKELRQRMTLAESVLWERLRGKRIRGIRFNRQSIIRGWIVDFWCPAKGLVIEVDGPYHEIQADKDGYRDAQMHVLGIRVLRVTNQEVFEDLRGVMAKIRRLVR